MNMQRGILILAGWLMLTGSALAQLNINTPWARVQVGQGTVIVQTPFVNVQVVRPVPAPLVMPPAVGQLPPGYIPPPQTTTPTTPTGPSNPPGYIPPPPGLGLPTDPGLTPPPPPKTQLTSSKKQPVVAAPTLQQFASTFQAVPGRHQVVIQHPMTGQPVEARFRLPNAQLRRIMVYPTEVCYDYGRDQVWLRFKSNGKVYVYD